MATKRERRAAKIEAANTARKQGNTKKADKLIADAKAIAKVMRKESGRTDITKTSGGNIKDVPSDTAARRSPTTYRPNVPIAKKGSKKVFTGTNIPTTGYTPAEIRDYNARLKADLADKNYRGANDVIFSIAFQKGGGEGNPRVGAVQSGMYRLKGKDTPLWAEGQVNSINDRYVLRNDLGEPTGEEVRFSDKTGVLRGPVNEWKPIDSWGGNARAGIVEGQPTKTPGVATNKIVSIVDLDTPGGMVLAGPGAGNLLDYAGPAGGSGIGTAVGDLMATTPYTQPAPQDWSNLRYTYAGSPQSELGQVTQTPASRAMFGDKGSAMQPWATGQGVPAGLLNYQIPGGTQANVAYSGGNPSLFDFNQQQNNQNNQQNNQQLNNQTNQQVDWAGVPVRDVDYRGYLTSKDGEILKYAGDVNTDPYKNFMDFNTRMNQAYYPGRQEAAQAAGAAGWRAFTDRGRGFQEAVPNTALAWQKEFGSGTQQAGLNTQAADPDAWQQRTYGQSALDQMALLPKYSGLLVDK